MALEDPQSLNNLIDSILGEIQHVLPISESLFLATCQISSKTKNPTVRNNVYKWITLWIIKSQEKLFPVNMEIPSNIMEAIGEKTSTSTEKEKEKEKGKKEVSSISGNIIPKIIHFDHFYSLYFQGLMDIWSAIRRETSSHLDILLKNKGTIRNDLILKMAIRLIKETKSANNLEWKKLEGLLLGCNAFLQFLLQNAGLFSPSVLLYSPLPKFQHAQSPSIRAR